MELIRDGVGGKISLDAMATNENKEKCSADVDGKNDGKSGTIRYSKYRETDSVICDPLHHTSCSHPTHTP